MRRCLRRRRDERCPVAERQQVAPPRFVCVGGSRPAQRIHHRADVTKPQARRTDPKRVHRPTEPDAKLQEGHPRHSTTRSTPPACAPDAAAWMPSASSTPRTTALQVLTAPAFAPRPEATRNESMEKKLTARRGVELWGCERRTPMTPPGPLARLSPATRRAQNCEAGATRHPSASSGPPWLSSSVDGRRVRPPQMDSKIGAWRRVAESTFKPGALPRREHPGDGQDAVHIVAAHQGRVEARRNHLDHRGKLHGVDIVPTPSRPPGRVWLSYQNRRHDLRLRKAQQTVADARESGHEARGFDAGRRPARVPACLDVVERGRRGLVDDPCPAVIATSTRTACSSSSRLPRPP